MLKSVIVLVLAGAWAGAAYGLRDLFCPGFTSNLNSTGITMCLMVIGVIVLGAAAEVLFSIADIIVKSFS